MTAPDPKPARRIYDPTATMRACLFWRECAVCGKPSATGHHLLSRKQGGDDEIANIAPLCGSGTTGCHGLIENEDEGARRALGAWIMRERPDSVRYLCRKLGADPAGEWLRRHLYVDA